MYDLFKRFRDSLRAVNCMAFLQGDKTLGMISRADVAAVSIGCLEGLCPNNVTFEVVNDKKNPYNDLQPLFAKLRPD